MIKSFFLTILPYLARLHPVNKKPERQQYPQLWDAMPKRWARAKTEKYPNGQFVLHHAKLRLFIEWLCEKLTGHEISKTERGYDGSNFVDVSCRWCDKSMRVHYTEIIIENGIFKDLIDTFMKNKEEERFL
jgi:hypothetical protein